jgi:hypothetical protein
MKKFIDIGMKLLTDRMPRKVAVASIVMTLTLVAFAVLFFVLGGAHDDAMEANANLKKNLDQISRNAKQSKDDRQFILDNKEKYEALLGGDRLIPHTRRTAMAQMQSLALQRGLTNLSYNFTAAGERNANVAGPVITGGYKIQVEKVDLKVGAALDSQVYDFMLDLADSFPGSAVVEQFTLERAPDITTDALNMVSRGRDSGLVKGEVHFTWRTAQAQDTDKKGDAPKAAK